MLGWFGGRRERVFPKCYALESAPCKTVKSLLSALALTDDLISQAKMPAASVLGRKGGSVTAKRHGSEHYRQMAARRKTHGGGRPRQRKESE